MMKNNIEWAKNRIKNTLKFEASNDREIGFKVAMEEALGIINQIEESEAKQIKELNTYNDELIKDNNQLINTLDELSFLSKNWIDEHVIDGHNVNLRDKVVYADELDKVLVPKQEITFYQVHDKLREESILSEKSFDYYWNCINDNVEIDEPGNLIAPKQKLPVIPRYVGEFIEEAKGSGDTLDDAFSILTGIYHQSEAADWLAKEKRNSEIFARAWLDGYTVEVEPLYYAMIKGHKLLGDVAKYWAHNKYDLEDLFISYETRDDSPIVVKNTKNHWDDLGINDSNANLIKTKDVE